METIPSEHTQKAKSCEDKMDKNRQMMAANKKEIIAIQEAHSLIVKKLRQEHAMHEKLQDKKFNAQIRQLQVKLKSIQKDYDESVRSGKKTLAKQMATLEKHRDTHMQEKKKEIQLLEDVNQKLKKEKAKHLKRAANLERDTKEGEMLVPVLILVGLFVVTSILQYTGFLSS